MLTLLVGSVMQRGWKSLLKGTRVVKNDATITLYRKHGSYDQALKEFKSLNPSNVRKVICPNLANVPLEITKCVLT